MNLSKLQVKMLASLSSITANLGVSIHDAFPEEKLLVSKATLDSTYADVCKQILDQYEAEGTSYDDASLPADYKKTFETASSNRKVSLDSDHDQVWARWIANINTKELAAVRTQLEKLAQETAVGDEKKFKAGITTIVEPAKSNFTSTLDSRYLGPNKDTYLQRFITEVDGTVKTRQALWSSNDQEVLQQVQRRLKNSQDGYEMKLNDSLKPERQPPPFEDITSSKAERVNDSTTIYSHVAEVVHVTDCTILGSV